MRTTKFRSLLLAAGAFLASAAAAPMVAAQDADATIPVAGSEAFLGVWTVNADGETGPVTLRVTLTNNQGRVAATLTGGAEDIQGRVIQRVSKVDGALVVGYLLSMQGQEIPTTLTLTPDGQAMKAAISLLDGMIVLNGEAKKEP